MSFYDELQWRGLIYDATPDLEKVLSEGKLSAYIGFDPTSSSLHIGSLVPIMALARWQRAGHRPVALVGGGTGMIGDPSGKSEERNLLSKEQVEENLMGLRAQLERYLDFSPGASPAILADNADWLGSVKLIDFLREIGKCFTANSMVQKESVKRRMESAEGISYTELSYMLLQAYDYLQLFDRYSCTLQMGGSDQWGNILSGIDLIRRLRNDKAHGLVMPLITMADGTKFGKTERGTIWLDSRRTSAYRYYQFWLNTSDADAVPFLKYFTWLSRSEIGELEEALSTAPEARDAQKKLAEELTKMNHGEAALQRAKRISKLFFGTDVDQLTADEVEEVVGDAPASELPAERLGNDGVSMIDLLLVSGLASSKGDARRTIKGGGIYLSNRRISDPNTVILKDQSIEGKLFLLRKGKKQYHVVRIVS
jgi:tyrosyl-tRNA synthetase